MFSVLSLSIKRPMTVCLIQKRVRITNLMCRVSLYAKKREDLGSDSLCFRALHWVTIQMLCVSMDEEIPEVSENVVKAITGRSV